MLKDIIRIENIHTYQPTIEDFIIYVGRNYDKHGLGHNAKLGNPFTVEEYGRETAINLYKVLIQDKNSQLHRNLKEVYKLIRKLYKLKKPIVLLCHCTPKPCHAEVIRNSLNWLYSEELDNQTNLGLVINDDEDLPPWDLDLTVEDNPIELNPITLHSGGAYGADTLFGEEASKYGIKVNHYYMGEVSEYNAPNGNLHITEQDMNEGKHKVALAANMLWGYQYKTMSDPRLIRNWSQVKYTEAVYAVANIVLEGEPVSKSFNETRRYKLDFISGSTGYAVAMAVQANKPVYFYAQDIGEWFKWNYQTKDFESIKPPTITERNFTGIGTRMLNEKGKQAIINLIQRSFNR